MACKLTPSTTATADFLVQTGSKVTLGIKGPSQGRAKLLHLRYGSNELDVTPPYQFTAKSGVHLLTVLVEAKPGVMIRLTESCGGETEQVIDRFHYDPKNPARGYIVRGKAAN